MENIQKDKRQSSRTLSFLEFYTIYEPLQSPHNIEGIRGLFFDRNELYLLSKELQDRKVWSLIKYADIKEFTQTPMYSFKIVSGRVASAIAYITTKNPWSLGDSIEVDVSDLLD